MRRKSSGVAVVALLVGVAVAAVVYIASFGKSSHHAEALPAQNEAVAHDTPASENAFALAPADAASSPQTHTAAR
jgi:flagellar basal body-associated protein FliL